MSQTIEREMVKHPNDPALMHRVLTPYRAKRCEYLQSAEISVVGHPPEFGSLILNCEFRIPESCYIDSTGHFNSVEFNICYNQMAYYLMAKSVQDKLIEPFASWSMEQFWARQLGDVLITDFRSSFRVQMRGQRFQGRLEITDIAAWDGSDLRDPLVVLRTSCRYWDEHGGDSFGEVHSAITNPPPLTDR